MDPIARDLVERYRQGDATAASELHDRFAGQMLNLVRGLLRGHSNRGVFDSEGIVQDGFRSFFSAVRKPAFDPEKGRIGGYLATIVANKARVKLRRIYPVNLSAEDLNAVCDAAAAFAVGSLSEPELNAALSQVIGDLLNELSQKERKILRLYLDTESDHSPGEIARTCRRSRATVAVAIARFSQRLKAKVIDSGLEVVDDP